MSVAIGEQFILILSPNQFSYLSPSSPLSFILNDLGYGRVGGFKSVYVASLQCLTPHTQKLTRSYVLFSFFLFSILLFMFLKEIFFFMSMAFYIPGLPPFILPHFDLHSEQHSNYFFYLPLFAIFIFPLHLTNLC